MEYNLYISRTEDDKFTLSIQESFKHASYHKICSGSLSKIQEIYDRVRIEHNLSSVEPIVINDSLSNVFRSIREARDFILAKKRILILVPHDDDATISFAALIIKERSKGHYIHVHEFTVGGPCSAAPQETRLKEYIAAMRWLKVSKYTWSGEGMDGKLSSYPNTEITGYIDNLVKSEKPHEVYCAALSEHADHKALYEGFVASCRLKSGWMPKLYAVGTYMFSNQGYVGKDGGKIFNPMDKDLYEKKLYAFSRSKSQYKPSPSPLGAEGLRIMSEFYGMLCGYPYAEMYYQLKYIRS